MALHAMIAASSRPVGAPIFSEWARIKSHSSRSLQISKSAELSLILGLVSITSPQARQPSVPSRRQGQPADTAQAERTPGRTSAPVLSASTSSAPQWTHRGTPPPDPFACLRSVYHSCRLRSHTVSDGTGHVKPQSPNSSARLRPYGRRLLRRQPPFTRMQPPCHSRPRLHRG